MCDGNCDVLLIKTTKALLTNSLKVDMFIFILMNTLDRIDLKLLACVYKNTAGHAFVPRKLIPVTVERSPGLTGTGEHWVNHWL